MEARKSSKLVCKFTKEGGGTWYLLYMLIWQEEQVTNYNPLTFIGTKKILLHFSNTKYSFCELSSVSITAKVFQYFWIYHVTGTSILYNYVYQRPVTVGKSFLNLKKNHHFFQNQKANHSLKKARGSYWLGL